MAGSSIERQLEKLTDSNYKEWEMQMSLYFRTIKTWNIVNGTAPSPVPILDKGNVTNQTEINKWEDLDVKSQSAIFTCVEPKQKKHISSATTAHEMWQKLEKLHSDKSLMNKCVTRTKFLAYKMGEKQTPIEAYHEIQDLASSLNSMGVVIPDEEIVAKIISALPSKLNSFRQAWQSVEENRQTTSYLLARLKLEEINDKYKDDKTEKEEEEEKDGKALFSGHGRGRGNYRGRGGFNRGGRGRGQSQGASDVNHSQPKDKGQFKCHFCKIAGHYKRDCYKYKAFLKSKGENNQDRNPQQVNAAVATTSGTQGEPRCFMMRLRRQEEKDLCDNWYSDSGATKHISGVREHFSTYTETPNGRKIWLADKSFVRATGYGSVNLIALIGDDWVPVTLKHVIYLPGSENLFSQIVMGKLGFRNISDDIGGQFTHKITGELGPCSVVVNDMQVMQFKMPYNVEIVKTLAAFNKRSNAEQWHSRFGHICQKYIQDSIRHGAITGISLDEVQGNFFCKNCQFGKQERKPHPLNNNKETEPGKKIWFDLAGKMPVPSIGGSNYFLLIKDEGSGFQCFYPLKAKSDASDHIMNFIEFLENKTQKKVELARSDRGGEFINATLGEYFCRKGISHGISPARTPQCNGFIENAMKTCKNLARSMLAQSGLDEKYWAEAVNVAVYLMNRTCKKGEKKTPVEIITGKKPNMAHLRTFGCDAYVRVSDPARKCWDNKAQRGILVGYEKESGAYRVYIPATRELKESMDVTFDEKEIEQIEDLEKTFAGLRVNSDDEIDNDDASQNATDITPPSEEPIREEPTASSSSRQLRPRENLRPPSYLKDYDTAFMAGGRVNEPRNYREAMESPQSEEWTKAIEAELRSHEENGTWKIVPTPQHGKVLSNRWVFKVKILPSGEVDKFKGRLCVRGFEEIPGEDYDTVYSPVTRYEAIRLILSIAAYEDMPYQTFDFSTAFLNAKIHKDVFMQIPDGIHAVDKDNFVLKLEKGLYGLSEAPKLWFQHLSDFLKKIGFMPTSADPSVYISRNGTILAIFVDDGCVVAKDTQRIQDLLDVITKQFKITLTDGKSYVGMELSRDEDGIKITQRKMIKDLIQKYNLEESKSLSVPMQPGADTTAAEGEDKRFPFRQILGSLLYVARISRPDISYAVSKLSQYTTCYDAKHFDLAKNIVRYLKSTSDAFLLLPAQNGDNGAARQLIAYTDADYAADKETRKSMSGMLILFGDAPITWSSNKQDIVSLSSCESEYISLCNGATNIIWHRRLLAELGRASSDATKILVDNTSAIRLAKSEDFHKRSKHFQVRYHFTRDLVKGGEIEVDYVNTNVQLADIFTKPLYKQKIEYFREAIGVKSPGLNFDKHGEDSKPKARMKSTNLGLIAMICLLFLCSANGLTLRNTIPVLWRESKTPISNGSVEIKAQIDLHSPCVFLTEAVIHKDLLEHAIDLCEQYYIREFLEPLQTFCPALGWEQFHHHLVKRFIFLTIFIVVGAIAALGITGTGLGIANAVENANQNSIIEQLEGVTERHGKMIAELQHKFNQTISRLNKHKQDYDELKAKSILSNYAVSYITSKLVSGHIIMMDTARAWEEEKVLPAFLDFLNISMPCGLDCPIRLAKAKTCRLSSDTKKLYMAFRVPVVNRDLVLLKPDSFKLLIRKGTNETCTKVFHGIENAVQSKSKQCVYGTNVAEVEDEIIFFPSERCTPASTLSFNTRYFSVDICKPREYKDEQDFIQTKLEGKMVHVYCPESMISIHGAEQRCPDAVFTIPSGISFAINGVPYTVDEKEIGVGPQFDPIYSATVNNHLNPNAGFNELYLDDNKDESSNQKKEETWTSSHIITIVVSNGLILLTIAIIIAVRSILKRRARARDEITIDLNAIEDARRPAYGE